MKLYHWTNVGFLNDEHDCSNRILRSPYFLKIEIWLLSKFAWKYSPILCKFICVDYIFKLDLQEIKKNNYYRYLNKYSINLLRLKIDLLSWSRYLRTPYISGMIIAQITIFKLNGLRTNGYKCPGIKNTLKYLR